MKKRYFVFIILFLMLAAALALRLLSSEDNWICQNGEWIKHGQPNKPKPDYPCLTKLSAVPVSSPSEATSAPVFYGSDIDEHGCRPSAGYSWCELKQKCLRSWEEECVAITAPLATDYSSEISLVRPTANETVSAPLLVEGRALGNWFFEATLPIKLIDSDHNVITSFYGQAKGEWMTSDFVDFKATLNFTTTATSGYLVLSRDNPSGLPENDASIMIPLKFKQ